MQHTTKRLNEGMQTSVNDIIHGESCEMVHLALRGALERGWLNIFGSVIDDNLKKKDNEIDRVCSRHSEPLIESVREILSLKSFTKHLEERVKTLNISSMKVSRALIDEYEIYHKKQGFYETTSKVRQVLRICQEINEKVKEVDFSLKEDVPSDFHALLDKYHRIEQLLHVLRIASGQSLPHDCRDKDGFVDKDRHSHNHNDNKHNKSKGSSNYSYIARNKFKFSDQVAEWLVVTKTKILDKVRGVTASFIHRLSDNETAV
jgi:hypothetical protein